MSEQKETFSIVRKIMSLFENSDETNLLLFFKRLVKNLEKRIKNEDLESKVQIQVQESQIENIKGQLEDAEEALIEVYLNVDTDCISNNAGRDEYAQIYMTAIDSHEGTVQKLKDQLEETTIKLKTYKREVSESKTKLNSRIDAIKAKFI